MSIKQFTLNFDGACLPKNPGGVAIASWVVRDETGKKVEVGSEEVCRGEGATNNVAEWAGLVYGLRALKKIHSGCLQILGDSQLVICQLNGTYRVKQEHLKPWKAQADELLTHFDLWKASHVPREQNHEADKTGKDKYQEMKQAEGK
jgi:ribonuclease HI